MQVESAAPSRAAPNADPRDTKIWSNVPEGTEFVESGSQGPTKRITHPMVQQFGSACYNPNPPKGCSYKKHQAIQGCTVENIKQGDCDFRKLHIPVGHQLEQFQHRWDDLRGNPPQQDPDLTFYNTYGPYFSLLPATQFSLHINRACSRWTAGTALAKQPKTQRRGEVLMQRAREHIWAAAKILQHNQDDTAFLLQLYRSPLAQIFINLSQAGESDVQSINVLKFLLLQAHLSFAELPSRTLDMACEQITTQLRQKDLLKRVKNMVKKASPVDMQDLSKNTLIALSFSQRSDGSYEAYIVQPQ